MSGVCPSARALSLGFTVLLIVTAFAPFVPVAAGSAPAASGVGLGMNIGNAVALTNADAAPQWGSYWVGKWMSTQGWSGFEYAMRTSEQTGATLVVYWYYWGDGISPDCVEKGCGDRSKAEWFAMTDELAKRLEAGMGGKRVLVVIENEFNKGGITGTAYAPTFDGYLENVSKRLKRTEGVETILGFGGWGEHAWSRFPLAIAASDMIGFQTMRASTRDTEAGYRAAPDRIAHYSSFIASNYDKPSFLYDLALSSYPDAAWEKIQAETLKTILDRRGEYAGIGLQGILYRELWDNPGMGTWNYYGEAEQHWGLWYSDQATPKPAWAPWLEAGRTPRPAAAPSNLPGNFEAEDMVATRGGLQRDVAATNGWAWNLWANGELRQDFHAPEAGRYRIDTLARGSPLGGVDTHMEMRIDGVVLGSFFVPRGYETYSVDADLPAGASRFAIRFTNDASNSEEDRNLVVDVVRVSRLAGNHAPTAAFSVSGADLAWTFDARSSSDPDGDSLSFHWSFGDGKTATGERVSHTYATGGAYSVTLTVSDGRAEDSTTASVRANRAPTASFSASGSDLTWTLDGSASRDPDGDALTYRWDLGDGKKASGKRVTHTYATGGTYTARLTVSDGIASATAEQVVRANRAPEAAFTTSGNALSWSFDASGSRDADGDALAYRWDLGDGRTTTGMRVSHTYATGGTYAVRLTVSDGTATSAAEQSIHANRAPTAAFSVTGANLTYTLDASASSDPDGDALTYRWDLGDGKTATGMRVTHTYATGGTYTPRLTVSDGFAEASASDSVRANRAPTAHAAASGSELTWTFDASGSTDPDGDALTYQWSFGDGRTATGMRVSHTYSAPGTFTARVTVSDGAASASASVAVTATANTPMVAAHRSMEAEDFAHKDNGARFGSSTASARAGWNLWGNGAMSHAFAPGEGTFLVEVVARGDFARGWPVMELRADGEPVARFEIGTESWKAYHAHVDFRAGETRTLSIHYVNDYFNKAAGEDRNLRLDVLRLSPTVRMVEAESFAHKDNGASFGSSTASARVGWNLWGNGAISQEFTPGAGSFRVDVTARGDFARGWPVMELRADGVAIARFEVDTATWRVFSADLAFEAHETKALSIHFVNDYFNKATGEDRNLRLDVVRLTPS